MKTVEQSADEQHRLHPLIAPRFTQEISMIVPGRRALGESWTRVTIGHDDEQMVVKTEAAEAPADHKPIMAMAGPDAEYASYILQAQMEKAKQRAVAPQELTHQERHDLINEAWHDYVEQKLRWLKGSTTLGAGGMSQRQRVAQNPLTRPSMRKER